MLTDTILDEDRKELACALKNISTSLSIWIGLIAAICTILPIVLGINANMNFKNEVEHVKEIMHENLLKNEKEQEKRLKIINERIEKSEDDFNKKVGESEEKLQQNLDKNNKAIRKSQINQTLSDLAVHMRVISELQDFESKGNGTFFKPELFVQVMDNTKTGLTKTSEILEHIDNNDKNIHIGITLMLCMLKRLLVSVECTFIDYDLITLQRLRAKIDNEVTVLIGNTERNEINNKKAIETAIKYVGNVQYLFNDFAKKQKNNARENR